MSQIHLFEDYSYSIESRVKNNKKQAPPQKTSTKNKNKNKKLLRDNYKKKCKYERSMNAIHSLVAIKYPSKSRHVFKIRQ